MDEGHRRWVRDGAVRGLSPREDVEREIRAHLAFRAEELEQAGWPPDEARREAERLFGDRVAISEECRQLTRRHDRAVRRTKMWGSVWQDLRHTVRGLVRSPGFTLSAVVTLAVGIGANTAIFSVVHGVLMKPLPYDDPEALVQIRETTNRGGTMRVAWANFLDWHEESRSFQALAAYGVGTTTVLGGDRPLSIPVANVSTDFWSVFRVVPVAGRLTTPEDHVEGAEPVLVVGQSLWENELGGLPLDRIVLEVRGVRARVVGVVPDGFDFPGGAEAWATAEPLGNTSRTSHNWSVAGRLEAGTPIEAAGEEIDALTKVIVLREPDADPDFLATGASVVGLRERLVGSSRTPLTLLFGAAALVLLVACTNLASTLLARGTTRARELRIRTSLGAGRWRVVRQLVTESLVLALLGGSVGLALAVGLTRILRALGPESLPRVEEIGVNASVLAFAFGAAVASTLVFGLLPALQLTSSSSGARPGSGGRGNSVDHRGPVWKVLVGTEVALALMLLTGSGLLVRSFQRLLSEDLGFEAADVATMPVALSRLKYESEHDHARLYTRLIEELEADPAIRSAGLLSTLPASGSLPNYRLELDGDLSKHTIGGYVVVSAGAFEALDIPLLRGRHFDRRDGPDDAHVAIVSESFAEQTWPGEDPIGKQVTGGGMDNFWEDRRFAEVVGVVGDVRVRDLAEEPYPTIYFPYTQRPFRIQYGAQVVAEAESGDTGAAAAALLGTVQRIDPEVPLRVVLQQTVVDDALASRRFVMLLLGGFSFVGLLLAGVGIYGVVAYSVARRTREMGIRVALGADPASVGRMVIRSAMQLVMGGIVVGVAGALAASRLLRSLLYEVEPGDPLTLVGVTALLVGTALLASWFPARAGTRTDPMVTMRAE
jgi:putative ABC transport system permease protein